MSIAVGTRSRLAYIPEVTHNTTPATPTLKILRTISKNINQKKNTLKSNEVISHGQVQDLRHGFQHNEGPIRCEWSLAALDDMLAGLFRSTWSTNRLNIGTTLITHTFERQFLDVGKYEVFTGVAVNQGEIKIMPDALAEVTFTAMGMGAAAAVGNATIASSTTAAPTNAPFDSFTGTLYEGGVTLGLVTGLTINVNAGNQLTPIIGQTFSPDVFMGTLEVTGTLDVMFQDGTLYDKFRQETASTVRVTLNDLADNTKGVDVYLPHIKYTGNDKDPSGTGPVLQSCPFQALYDQSEQTSIYIVRRP